MLLHLTLCTTPFFAALAAIARPELRLALSFSLPLSLSLECSCVRVSRCGVSGFRERLRGMREMRELGYEG